VSVATSPGTDSTAALPSPDTIPGEIPETLSLSPEYARMDENGAVIVGKSEWYLEELDAAGLPANGTVWQGGKIVRRISWVYYDGSAQSRARIETNDTTTTETLYDPDGNITAVTVTGADGTVLSKTGNTYTKDRKLSSTVLEKDKKLTRTEYVYSKGGTLAQKKIFVDGSLASEFVYKDGDNWTENVYMRDELVLVMVYENGVRRQDRK
jgi:YD repeat-containing protein